MEVATLVALAGNALVTAAMTDAWEDVRHKVARLFGRGQANPKIEQRLDATWATLEAAAASTELQAVRSDQAARWSGRLSDLLEDFPDAEAELRALIEEIQARGPAPAHHSAMAGRDMLALADRGSVAANVIHGNVAPDPQQPGPGRG
jgi:hypothetical protein